MRKQRTQKETWLLGIGFILFWNSGFIGAEYVLPYTKPLTLLFWRYCLLALLLLVYLVVRGRLEWPGMAAASVSALVGVLAHGVWLGCVFYSLQYGVPAGIVALVVALQPLVTGAFSGLIVGERTSFLGWLGLLTGFCGVLVAVLARTDLSDAESLIAFFVPFGSVVAITGASLIQRRMEVNRGRHRLALDLGLFYQSVGVVLVTGIPAYIVEGLVMEWTPLSIGGMFWLVVGVSLVAYALMWTLIGRIDATRVASLFYFGPPVTMVMAWIAFGDPILVTDLAGLAIVVVGVFLTQHPGWGKRTSRGGGSTP